MSADTDIRGEWRRRPFPDVIDFQEGPGILAKDFRPSGVPLVRLAGLEKGARVLDGCNFLDPDMVDRRWAHFRVKPGDTLLSTSASLGRTAVVDEESAGSIPYTGIIRMRPREKSVHQNFIRFVLESPDFQRQAEAMGAGSVIRHFGPSHLRQMTLLLPPLEDQHAIAHILGTLDDKIELNRRMNQTLDEIARLLFTSWFVTFDPVRAKAEGRQPEGMDAEMAALFPDSFADTELGEVPAGWEVRSLDEIASYLNGLALQRFPVKGDESLPAIKIAQLRRGDSVGADRVGADVPPEYIIEDGDVLFSWSGSLEVEIWCGGRGALNQHLFKVTSPRFPMWFYYLWTKYHLPDFRAIAASKATTMGHIQRHHLKDAKTLVPPPALLTMMNVVMSPFIQRIIAGRIESRTLAEARDMLLPRLLSGELTIPEAPIENLGRSNGSMLEPALTRQMG